MSGPTSLRFNCDGCNLRYGQQDLAVQIGTLTLCAFGSEGQGSMSRGTRFCLWKNCNEVWVAMLSHKPEDGLRAAAIECA